MSLQTGSPGLGCNVCPNVQSGTITRARSFCKVDVSSRREEGIFSYFRTNYPFYQLKGIMYSQVVDKILFMNL